MKSERLEREKTYLLPTLKAMLDMLSEKLKEAVFKKFLRSVLREFSIRHRDTIVEYLGEIEGINALVNFEGGTVKELTDVFHEAVDDYLIFCKRKE